MALTRSVILGRFTDVVARSRMSTQMNTAPSSCISPFQVRWSVQGTQCSTLTVLGFVHRMPRVWPMAMPVRGPSASPASVVSFERLYDSPLMAPRVLG